MLHTGGGWGETPTPHDCKALWVYSYTQWSTIWMHHSLIHSFKVGLVCPGLKCDTLNVTYENTSLHQHRNIEIGSEKFSRYRWLTGMYSHLCVRRDAWRESVGDQTLCHKQGRERAVRWVSIGRVHFLAHYSPSLDLDTLKIIIIRSLQASVSDSHFVSFQFEILGYYS